MFSEFAQLFEPDIAAAARSMYKSHPVSFWVNYMGIEMKHIIGKIKIIPSLCSFWVHFIGNL